MKAIIFREEMEYVNNYLKLNDGHYAFWFAPGLTSYTFLDEVIELDSLLIEQGIIEEVKQVYPHFLKKYTFETFSVDKKEDYRAPGRKICFFASNDTIMKSFVSILINLDPSSYDIYCRPNENADKVAEKHNIKYTKIKYSIPDIKRYSLLVVGNDWGPLEKKINMDFIQKKVNTVCVQESSIDFNPIDGRMRNCSFPIFQGVATLENLDITNRACAVIGNPRFEELKINPTPLHNKVMINVNFTYGVFEEYRDVWVDDIISTCNELKIEYVLSQHPRDRGNFEGHNIIKSNPLLVHQTLIESTVLISRFSALLTEAICLGRPAVYYNPHNENMWYKFESDDVMFFYATNKTELEQALKKIIALQKSDDQQISNFLEKHLGNTTEGNASKFISMALKDIVSYPFIKSIKLIDRLKIYYLILKGILLKRPI